MNIDKHISGLLYHHDCVIVPEFGGFVGNMRPARLDEVRHRFYPPRKEISFNRHLINNDGLLANRIAVEENKSYQQATADIRAYVRDISARLERGSRVVVADVGTLYREAEALRFEPDRSVNFAQEAFGMHSVHAASIEPKPQPQPVVVPAPAPTPEKAAPTRTAPPADLPPVPPTVATQPQLEAEKRRKRKAIVWIPAILLLLLFGTYAVWATYYSGAFAGGNLAIANLNPFSPPCATYTPRTDNGDFLPYDEPENAISALLSDSVQFVSVSFLDAALDATAPSNEIVVKVREAVAESTAVAMDMPPASYRFHVIGGCFRYLENAEKLVERLRRNGFGARIYDRHNGLYRVTYNSYPTRREALVGLERIKLAENPAAWLLVK